MTDQPKLTIRRATLADLPAIMSIERVSFPTPWSSWFFNTEIINPYGRVYLVAVLDATLVGYIGSRCDAGECHIGTLAVHQDHRRSGIAEGLSLTLLKYVRDQGRHSVTLEYRIRNYPAARLYKKLGFGQLRIRPGYYQDTGEDAVGTSITNLTTAEWGQRLDQQWEAWVARHNYELEIVI